MGVVDKNILFRNAGLAELHHFIHANRRNINLNMILLNNRIYGLTKGQYSPTSPRGFVSKSSPSVR